jgi:hypothetical protein
VQSLAKKIYEVPPVLDRTESNISTSLHDTYVKDASDKLEVPPGLQPPPTHYSRRPSMAAAFVAASEAQDPVLASGHRQGSPHLACDALAFAGEELGPCPI